MSWQAQPLSEAKTAALTVGRHETWPWLVLLTLLTVCLAHGLWITHGLGSYTAILDTYRDAGFIQGFLDGNLDGDPSIEGAKRYYPPLLHALAACAAFVLHTRPLDLLVHAAPWINLLVPATFFMMSRRLLGPRVAAVATTLFVCFDGIFLPPWMAASYTPWHSVPAVTQALFFGGVWLISARVQQARFIDTLFIGSAVGLVFLAHTVPALILAVITTAAALAAQGVKARTVAWVTSVGVVTSLWALPFVMPLVINYHLTVLNAAGGLIDPLFEPGRIPTRVIAASLPGLGALVWLGWSVWKAKGSPAAPGPANLAACVILAVWIVVPALFIARHFRCGGAGTSAVCKAFVVPVHHWMFYLQSALACVFGYAFVRAITALPQAPRSSPILKAVGIGVLAASCAMLLLRPMDHQMRDRALDMRNRVDIELYQWLLANTRPGALFVTDVSTDAVHDTAAIAVLAAGRKSVALPFTFSNPYIEWPSRREREDRYLAAAQSGADKPTLCQALTEARRGNALYIALATQPGGMSPPGDQLRAVFRSSRNELYLAQSTVCDN